MGVLVPNRTKSYQNGTKWYQIAQKTTYLDRNCSSLNTWSIGCIQSTTKKDIFDQIKAKCDWKLSCKAIIFGHLQISSRCEIFGSGLFLLCLIFGHFYTFTEISLGDCSWLLETILNPFSVILITFFSFFTFSSGFHK